MNKNSVLEIKLHNWSEMTDGDRSSVTWKLNLDLTVDIISSYARSSETITEQRTISKPLFADIIELELQSEHDQSKPQGVDGAAWSVKRYKDGNLVYECEPRYIYGIESLEKLTNILHNTFPPTSPTHIKVDTPE